MKRILSLFLSIVLVMSVLVVPADAITVDETTMIEKTNVITDLTNVENFTVDRATYSNTCAIFIGGTKNMGFYTSPKGFYVYNNTDKFGYSTLELKRRQANGYAQFHYNLKGMNGTDGLIASGDISGKTAVVEARMYATQSSKHSWKPSPSMVENNTSQAVKANTWYKVKATLNFNKNIVLTYEEELSAASSAENVQPHSFTTTLGYNTNNFSYFRFSPGMDVDESIYIDDLKIYWESVPYKKAEITNVGTNDVAEGGQNVLPVTLSADIPGITKDNITVTNLETNQDIDVSSIEITSDGTNPVVKASLSSKLASWSEYKVTIDADAFGAGAMQRTGDGEAEAVTDISREFETSKPPFATKGFEFESVGGEIVAKGLVANTTGTPKNIKMVFSAFNSDGTQGAIVPTNYSDFNNALGEEIEASITIDDSEKYNFFIIDGWTNKTPLLGVSANVDESGSIVAETAVSGGTLSGTEAAISADELNHDTLELSVRVDTKEAAVADGILLVYAKGETLSDTNLPLYVKSVSTATDGTLAVVIPLTESLQYGEYTVEFVSDKLTGSLTKTFNYYSPAEILANKKAAILADAKVASSAEGLQEVLLSVNSAGEKVNDNVDVFGKDADMTDYNKNIDKLSVFTAMLPSLSNLADYDALVNLFETCASNQRATEVAARKLQIVNDAKQSANAQTLMMVIMGVDANGNTVNDNFDVISSNANMAVYNSLKNKAAVFNHMVGLLNGVSDYNSLLLAFESAARTQQSKENVKPSTSSNNSSYGGSSVAVKETVDTPATQPGQGTTVSNSVFTDMSGHWALNYVEALYKRGIMNGYVDGSFRGGNSITRAEIAKTIVEAFEVAEGNSQAFSDVQDGSWYSDYVASAAAAGIVTGFENGTFGPDISITRQDAAVMIYRALSTKMKLPIGYTFFNDDLDIADYASGAIRTLGDLGIITGNENKEFKPNSPITRAEIATIICRALDYVESH